MRTLKGKRLWPVLAMTPVFALAAFLAFGLIAGNGVPTAQAQDPDCKVDSPLADRSCTVSGDTAVVEFSGNETRGEDGAATYLVYAKDGNIDGGTDVALRLPGTDAAASSTPLSFKSLEIAGGTLEADGSITKSTGSITVENLKGTDVDDGRVTLYAYVDDGMEAPAVGADEILKTPAAEVTIVFLGVPVLYQDPEADPPVERSKVQAFPTGRRGSIDPNDASTVVLTDDDASADVEATVQDMNGRALSGEITFAAESDPPEVFSRVITKELDSNGMEVFTVSQLPTDSAFRITVTVTYDDGSDDGFAVGTATILRSGNLHSLTAAVCVTDMDNDADEAGCPKGEKPQSVFTRDADDFKVRGTALDNLDSPADVEFSVTVPDEAKDFISSTVDDTTDTGMLIATIDIDEDDAVSGRYILTVAAEQAQGSDEDPITMEAEVEITISGDLAKYTLDGPDTIALGDIATYTVSALDDNGAPATIDDDNNTVTVLSESDSVRLFDLTDDTLELGTNGKATFRVRANRGAAPSVVTIDVYGIEGIASVSKDITIGDFNTDPEAVGELGDVTLTVGDDPVTVDVSGAFTDADGDELSYMAESDNPAVATASVEDPGASTVTITAVAAGSATVTVTASDPDGASATQTIAVTVAAAPVPGPGPVHAYSIEGLAIIPLTAFATVYTVSAVDENGNTPAFDDDNNVVTVVVQGILADNVKGLDDRETVTLDENTGEATFTIITPANVAKDHVADITILVGDNVVATLSVTFGVNAGPTAEGMLDPVMLTVGDAPVTVDAAGAFDDDDMLSYMVESDDEAVATASVDAAGMVTITAVGVGMATVTVTASDPRGESAMQDIEVTVEEPPAPDPLPVDSYSIEGLEIIPLDPFASAVYTVKAVDENGDLPAFADGNDVVEVVVQGIPADSVRGLDDGTVTLDAETGEATFTIVKPADAAKGDTAHIGILVGGNVVGSKSIVFGAYNVIPSAVGTLDAVMLTEGDAPVMVDVSGAFTDDDMLSYMAESNNEAVATASVDAAGMVTITAVGVGSATVTVTASDPDGESATQDIAVTVAAAPVPELGDPSGLSATSAAAGEATVTWTPGANATVHWVWSAPRDGSAGMWTEAAGDAGMATVSGLTSGADYWFIVIAGQAPADDGATKFSNWTNWSALTTIQ